MKLSDIELYEQENSRSLRDCEAVGDVVSVVIEDLKGIRPISEQAVMERNAEIGRRLIEAIEMVVEEFRVDYEADMEFEISAADELAEMNLDANRAGIH